MSEPIIASRCEFRAGHAIDIYKVEKSLGEGAFGKVYRVRSDNNEVYALKLLKLWEIPPEIRKQLIDRFDMEFQTGRIDSPYLVHSVGHGTVSGNPYIVMEYCPSGDLLEYAGRPAADLIVAGRQILLGLRDLHKCGKVHRDLKPENVLIKKNGIAALTDFGISGDRNKRMTERNILGKPKQIFGTYAYMPPEQVNRVRGDATVLPTTDIFSFGVMMYQLLTGELPFGSLFSENDLAVYLRNGKEERWDRSRLTERPDGGIWEPVISGCLKSDFRQRLQSAGQVLSLLPPSENAGSDRDIADDWKIVRRGVLLRIMQGEEYGKTYKITEMLNGRGYGLLRLGRSGENSICIRECESAYISRFHCTIEKDSGSACWYIRDGQWHAGENGTRGYWKTSLNGTYINSSLVPPEGMAFCPGDIISLGDVKLRVEGY